MIIDFGGYALYSALIFAFLQGTLPLLGLWKRNPYLLASARLFAHMQCIALLSAYCLLTLAFIQNDFSLAYVANNSHPLLPVLYRATAAWGGHEGSILFWTLLISGWTIFASTTLYKFQDNRLLPATIAILGLLNICFLLFLILTSNPFLTAAVNQQPVDLNPLLQDPGFVIHPPMLYIGYVGFSVTFALTQAALLLRIGSQEWSEICKKFAMVAWCFLTLGITLGSWWAYRVLGWGGFWFWDPVENASLLPWLAATALIHLLSMVKKKNIGFLWAVMLANITFALSLLGTFLVRSGVLVSAHTFANDPARGLFLLLLFGLVACLSLLLFMFRFKHYTFRIKEKLLLLSRETSLCLNAALLFIAMLTILLGTIYPLMMEALHLGSISVGAPYFNSVMAPLTYLIMFVMGLGALCQWQDQFDWQILKYKIINNGLLSLFLGPIFIYLLSHQLLFYPALTLTLSIWIILSVVKIKNYFRPITIAHCGFAITIIGIMLSSLLQQDVEAKVKPGDQIKLANYQFLFLDTQGIQGNNYRGISAAFDVTKNAKHIVNLYPEKRIYTVRDMVMTNVDIHPGIFRDLYVALGEPLEGAYWSVHIYYKPFIRFIWAGGLLMILGGLLTLRTKTFRSFNA